MEHLIEKEEQGGGSVIHVGKGNFRNFSSKRCWPGEVASVFVSVALSSSWASKDALVVLTQHNSAGGIQTS